MAHQLTRELDPDAILQHAAQSIAGLKRWRAVELAIPTADGRHWRAHAGAGAATYAGRPLTTGAVGRAYHTGAAQHLADLGADLEEPPDAGADRGGSRLAIPITFTGQVLGVLSLTRARRGAFSHGEVAFAQACADLIAIALSNAQRLTAIEQEAIEQARVERELRDVLLTLESAEEQAGLGSWTFDVRTSVGWWSRQMCALFGRSPADGPPSIEEYFDLIHPEDQSILSDTFEHMFRGDLPERRDFRTNPARCKLRILSPQYRVEKSETGKVIRFIGTLLDTTELKTAQRELLELNYTLEERVKARTAEVQDLYDNAPTGYHSLDAEGKVIMVNQTELQWLGYTHTEMIGRPFWNFITPQSFTVFQQNFPTFKQRGWVKDLEFEYIRKDGGTFPILLSATAIYDAAGNFVMSRSTSFDNTERKRSENALRESEEHNRLLFEEAPDAVILFDAAGRALRMNRAFEGITGYTSAQFAGHTVAEMGLLPEAQVTQLEATAEHALQLGSVATSEIKFQRADGVIRDIGVRIFAFKIDDRQHYLATMRDVTAYKQAEVALRVANIEMGRALRMKDEFLANMSHELRTPLNAILAFSESMLEHLQGPLNEHQAESLRHIETSGRHLLALINDILDLSKVEAGRLDLQPEPVPVADVCQSSLQFVKEIAIRKHLQLDFQLNDPLAEMLADPRRLKQMLVNLLSNAVKFTPPDGRVSLEVEVRAEASQVSFAIRDTGVGIKPEDLSRLFQPFIQLDSSLSRQHEGSGLGLALVHRLAELHGGSIVVESAVGGGSCFTITLPYHAPKAESPAAHVVPEDSESDLLRSALVIDDSASTAEQLSRYLRELRIQAVICPQGAGALEQAASLQPSLILLDLLLPDQSGWEVLAQLKADPRTRAIPVIIISVIDDRGRGRAAGAAEYLVKPISREVLRQALHLAVAGPTAGSQALVIAPDPAPPLTGAQIMLAEDNEVNIMAIGDYLQAKGYRVVVARTGRQALDLAGAMQLSLILMDIQMPEMDGLEAIRHLRARSEYATTPIVALTALVMPGDRERCLAAGASEYLSKPISLKGLAATIKQLLA